MCQIHRLNYVSKGIGPTNFQRVFFHPVSEMNEKTESELIDKMRRSGPRCEQNRKCKGTLLYNHLICFWKSAISFLMSFLSFGKTKQDCNWVFLFCMLVQKPFFFHHLWLTFRDPALEESELMSLHNLIFSPNSGNKTLLSCFLDECGLGTSSANAKVKVIYEISHTLSLQMSYTFPLRTSTPPSLHPSAPAFPSTVGESSSLAKEQDIIFSVWMTRKYFWKECVSLEQLNPKGNQGDTCKHLPWLNMQVIYWLLFCFLPQEVFPQLLSPRAQKKSLPM